MIKLKHSGVTVVETHPLADAALSDVIQDALVFAVTEWCNVRFVFNGMKCEVMVNDLAGQVKKVKETQDERSKTQS